MEFVIEVPHLPHIHYSPHSVLPLWSWGAGWSPECWWRWRRWRGRGGGWWWWGGVRHFSSLECRVQWCLRCPMGWTWMIHGRTCTLQSALSWKSPVGNRVCVMDCSTWRIHMHVRIWVHMYIYLCKNGAFFERVEVEFVVSLPKSRDIDVVEAMEADRLV